MRCIVAVAMILGMASARPQYAAAPPPVPSFEPVHHQPAAPPAEVYGPPAAPPPPPPPPPPPAAPPAAYGPPAAPVPAYGPPAAPVPAYGPPAAPVPAYGPPAAPVPAYGPPAAPVPAYGPPAALAPEHEKLLPAFIAAPPSSYGAPQEQLPTQNDQLLPTQQQPQDILQLPEGGRVLLSDKHGQYSHGFNDQGTQLSEQGRLISTNDGWEAVIVKEGSYSYISPEGVPINVKYVADEKGFRVISR